MGFDLDAGGLSIIDCGGKNAIPFYARSCRALGIPCVVLHDEDLYQGDDLAKWQQDSNRVAPSENASITEAASSETEIYVVSETLESALGVGRNTRNKPMRVLEAVRIADLKDLPTPLVDAVTALSLIVNQQTVEDDALPPSE